MTKKLLGLGVKYQPASIGVHYRQDGREKVYHIKLNRLLFVPRPEEAAAELVKNHPEYLKEVGVKRVSKLVEKIQDYNNVFD
jgi:hypothetical protein